VAFQAAIAQNEYKGQYVCVYPIKVNQQRHVCEQIANTAINLNFGLEAGSKPELLAVLVSAVEREGIPIATSAHVTDLFADGEMLFDPLVLLHFTLEDGGGILNAIAGEVFALSHDTHAHAIILLWDMPKPAFLRHEGDGRCAFILAGLAL
jgi:hypothetical protein